MSHGIDRTQPRQTNLRNARNVRALIIQNLLINNQMLNITDTKTAQIDECQYFKKLDTDTSKSIVVCVKGDVVAVYNDSRTQIEFSRESNSKEFEEQYLKVMIELGLIDCFTKLGFKMSPTVQQMTIAQWNERISKQAKP